MPFTLLALLVRGFHRFLAVFQAARTRSNHTLASFIVCNLINLLSISASLPNNRQNQPFLHPSGTQRYAKVRKNTQKYARILFGTLSAFLVLSGTQPANDSSSAPKKQPKTNSSKFPGGKAVRATGKSQRTYNMINL